MKIPSTVSQPVSSHDSVLVRGRTPIVGEVPCSGAKNAVLPMMMASLLTNDWITLVNVPKIS